MMVTLLSGISEANACPGGSGKKKLTNATLNITNASYGDFDDDGFIDDIEIIAELVFDGAVNQKRRIHSWLFCFIETPSGDIYYFYFNIRFSLESTHITFIITAYNTAKESGWYQIDLFCLLLNLPPRCRSLVVHDSEIFDPPTGQGSGDPTAKLVFF